MSDQWREQAKCAGLTTDNFYPPRDKNLYKPIADGSKAVCRGRDGRPECASRWECLWDAIDRDEAHGIWGGYSHRERNAIVRRWHRDYRHLCKLSDYILDGLKP